MPAAILPNDDAQRLRSLRDLAVLDTEPQQELDGLVRTAALVCGVPISLISLVDEHRQWFKANIGLPGVTETHRDLAFCAHAIHQEGIFEVPDAILDFKFQTNPLVTGDPNIRFYAGATLRLSDGTHAGTLCVIDRQPRKLDTKQREILGHLATAAVKILEGRRVAMDAFANEARFKSLSAASPVGVFETDASGDCTYTNERWQSIFGLTLAESLGSDWSRTLHPQDRAAVFTEWQRTAADGQGFDMEFRIQRDDGATRHVRSIANPIFGEDGRVSGHVGAVEDVTERKAIEERLRQKKRLLDRTGVVAGVGGWELDIVSGLLSWSDQTCRIHGLEPGHQPSLADAINFYAPEARPVIQAAVERAMSSGGGWDLELPFIQINGNRITVRAVGQAEFENGKPKRLLGAFQDVTEAAAQRAQLAAAHERMSLATESGGIGIWSSDFSDNSVVWDATTYRLFGELPSSSIAPSELWIQRVHPDDFESTEKVMRDARAGVAPYDHEFRVVWPDGSIHHLRGMGRVTANTEGGAERIVGINWDVTQVRELSAKLAQEHELLRVTLMSIGDAVITTDPLSNIEWMNPVAERLTGWLASEAKGRQLQQVFHVLHEETRLPAENPIAVCLKEDKVSGLANHTVLVSRNGVEFGIEDSAAPIRHENGQVLGAVLVFHDVTEQRRLSGEMSYRATPDQLTGLLNRAEFENRLKRLLQKSHEDHSKHALMFIDLDQFKLVNDACGHSVGDQLLQQVSKMLGESVRSRDTLARLGGDEFGVLLDHCTIDQAQRVAELICEKMNDFRFLHDNRRFRIGTSIGLVPMDNRWATTAAVMQAADTSCYAAKEAGRNRVHTWFDTDAAMRARHGEMQWTTRIEQALDENRFVLFAQNIESLTQPQIGLHAEVLLRMLDVDGSFIAPGAFLPAAERFHLASRIDRWVLRRATDWLASQTDPSTVDTLCINLSGQSIGDRTFHRHATELLGALGHDICRRLCLEITETAAVTNLADAALFIEQVRALGVRIALDDFGAGASSFGYLKNLHVDVLKIDGQFIKDLIDDPLDDAAVRCFVDVAKVVGLKTVAEFVDRKDVLQRVKALGVDFAQGYLMHRPEPLDAVFAAFQKRELITN